MFTVRNWVFFIASVGFSTIANAAFDGSSKFLCATQSVSECVAGQHCEFVSPASMNIPDFYTVSGSDKLIEGDGRQTPIERVENLDGKLILQGADDGVKDLRDGMGWTMIVDNATGKMSLTAAGDGFAVVIFGACIES